MQRRSRNKDSNVGESGRSGLALAGNKWGGVRRKAQKCMHGCCYEEKSALETFGKGKDGQWARLGCRIRLLYLGSSSTEPMVLLM